MPTASSSTSWKAAHAEAALMFTCNGRGTRLFDESHHDAGLLRRSLGPVPVAGFFAAGEIGPIGGDNFVHAFSASMALFRDHGRTAGSARPRRRPGRTRPVG